MGTSLLLELNIVFELKYATSLILTNIINAKVCMFITITV